MGQLTRLRTELPESAAPLVPRRWGELNTVTIAFGQGLSVAPLQAVMGISALMNGGYLIPPTFMKRTRRRSAGDGQARDQAGDQRQDAVSDAAQCRNRHCARSADVKGYYVGGKTGTSEKVINGRYAKKRVLNSFTAIMPSDDPKYQILVMLDEPQALPETLWFHHLGL